jgi:pimeloyl-ACP methyl ester carboxylesterase
MRNDMNRSTFVAASAAAAVAANVAAAKATTTPAHYVLCHGAFADQASWQRVTPLLQAAGASVSVVALPGHSDADSAMAGRVTLPDYVAAIKAKLDESSGPVILVGHSLGGVIITQSAELFPDKIAALVYLSAYLPENGKSLLDYSKDPQSKLGPGLVVDAAHGIATISHDTMQAAFFNNTPPLIATEAQKHLRPEPIQPFTTPVTTSAANFGRLPRYYITTSRDQAVGPDMQKTMYTALPVRKVYTVDTDHSSYFSAPADVAKALLDVRQSIG